MKGQFLSGIPVLVSNDFDRAVTFYRQFGLSEVARYDESYLILRRDGLELHFRPQGNHDPAASDCSAYVRMLNVSALTKEWASLSIPSNGIPRYVTAHLRPWGMIEAHIVDPDGNLLVLGAANEDPAP